MKILVFISLLLIVLSSCPYDGGRIYDAFSGKDRMPPEMQSFSLVDNSYMKIVYDETVTVIDARLDDIPLRDDTAWKNALTGRRGSLLNHGRGQERQHFQSLAHDNRQESGDPARYNQRNIP